MKKRVTLHVTVAGRKYTSAVDIDYPDGELSASAVEEGLVRMVTELRDAKLQVLCCGEEVSGFENYAMLEKCGVVVVAKVRSKIDSMDVKLFGVILSYLRYKDALSCRLTSRRLLTAFSDWTPLLSVKQKHLPTESISGLLWSGLRRMNLSHTNATDHLWEALSSKCSLLELLDLSWCHNVCDLSNLQLPFLKELNINGCYRLHSLPAICKVPLLECVATHVGALPLCLKTYGSRVSCNSFINVYVSSVCQQILIKKLSPTATAIDLMMSVEASTGIPIGKQTIVFKGSICNPDDVLTEKGITDCTTVFLSFPIISVDCVEKKL